MSANEEFKQILEIAKEKKYKYFRIKSGNKFYFSKIFLTEKEIYKMYKKQFDFYFEIEKLVEISNECIKMITDNMKFLMELNAPESVIKKQVKILKNLAIEFA